jgi:hypothetical protein
MTPPNAGNVIRPTDVHTRALQPFNQRFVVLTSQSRVRLLCRTEVSLHTQVNLNPAAFEPTASALCKFEGLRNFDHTEHLTIESARSFFAPRGHSELHVINRGKRWLGHAEYLNWGRRSGFFRRWLDRMNIG